MEHVDLKEDLAGTITGFHGGLVGTYPHLLWKYNGNIMEVSLPFW